MFSPDFGLSEVQIKIRKDRLTRKRPAPRTPPPPTTGAKQWGRRKPVGVFDIVELERETQAAAL